MSGSRSATGPEFPGALAVFDNTEFCGGTVSFRGTRLSGSTVDFSEAGGCPFRRIPQDGHTALLREAPSNEGPAGFRPCRDPAPASILMIQNRLFCMRQPDSIERSRSAPIGGSGALPAGERRVCDGAPHGCDCRRRRRRVSLAPGPAAASSGGRPDAAGSGILRSWSAQSRSCPTSTGSCPRSTRYWASRTCGADLVAVQAGRVGLVVQAGPPDAGSAGAASAVTDMSG
jgi:hypothetical protein